MPCFNKAQIIRLRRAVARYRGICREHTLAPIAHAFYHVLPPKSNKKLHAYAKRNEPPPDERRGLKNHREPMKVAASAGDKAASAA